MRTEFQFGKTDAQDNSLSEQSKLENSVYSRAPPFPHNKEKLMLAYVQITSGRTSNKL
jgi:hypothetical protein